MIKIADEEANRIGLNNVQTVLRDFIAEGPGLSGGSVGYVMLFNILHLEEPVALINEAKRILREGGTLGVIFTVGRSSFVFA